MSISVNQILIVVGMVVASVGAFAFLLVATRRLTAGQADRGTAEVEGGARLASRFRALGSFLRPGDDTALEELKSRTTRAGLYGRDAVDLFLTIRLVGIVAAAVSIAVAVKSVESPLMAMLLVVIIGGVAVIGPGAWLDVRANRRQAEVSAEMPEALDLLALCLEAGLGLPQALERVSNRGDSLLSRELRMVLSDVSVGLPVDQAFHRFAVRVGSDDVKTVAALVSKGTSLGSGIGGLLRDQVNTMRDRQLSELETLAGKASAKLSLPLTICLLPAGMMLLMGPIFYSVFKQF
jgi:tight adherence protein C